MTNRIQTADEAILAALARIEAKVDAALAENAESAEWTAEPSDSPPCNCTYPEEMDVTDGACPAWWRGEEYAAKKWTAKLSTARRHAATWKALAKRLRAQLDSTWSIIVSLRAELAEPPMCEPWCGVPGASPIKGSRLAWCHFACRDADRPLRAAPPQDVTAAVDKLRADGWMVAVHNDYRLSGKAMTFWLFTHPDGRWIKGEGTSDDEAISKAAAQIKVSAVVVTAAVEAVCRCGHSESFHDNDEGANDGGECMFFSREMGMCSCNWLAPKDAHPSVPQRCAPEQHRWCDPYQIHISHGDDPWLRACDECGISIYTTAPEAAPVDMPRDVRKAIYADLPSLYTTSPTPEAAPVPDAPAGVRSVLKVNPFYPPRPPIATPPAEPPTAEPYSRRCPADSGGEPADDDNGCMADDAAEGLCAPGFCAGVNNWKGGLVWPCPDGTKAATPPAEPAPSRDTHTCDYALSADCWKARAEALQSKGEAVTHHLGVAMMDVRLLTAKVEALQAERDEAVELLRLYCPPKQHEQAIAEFLARIDAKGKP